MKKMLFALAAVALLFPATGMARTKKVGGETPVDFHEYTSYFENNDSGLRGQKSYLVITSRKRFNKVFGPAAVMGTNSFIPDDTFKTRIIVTTIKRGDHRDYSDVKVTEKNGILWVSYTTKDSPPGGATYRCPLIIAVDKGKYKEVVFMENGKRAGMARLRGTV
jgi:hypothetical protein